MTVCEASTWVTPVIIAITFHEAAHGFVALLFGDGTAWRLGRVSFNPLKHIDLFGRHCHIEQVEAVIDHGEAKLRHWNHVAGLSPGRQ
jgi:Zn-dependent protease